MCACMQPIGYRGDQTTLAPPPPPFPLPPPPPPSLETAVSQLFNPPFVHSVDFTADGCFLAAGLGDSGVVVVDAKTRAPVGRCDGHSAPISQVLCSGPRATPWVWGDTPVGHLRFCLVPCVKLLHRREGFRRLLERPFHLGYFASSCLVLDVATRQRSSYSDVSRNQIDRAVRQFGFLLM